MPLTPFGSLRSKQITRRWTYRNQMFMLGRDLYPKPDLWGSKLQRRSPRTESGTTQPNPHASYQHRVMQLGLKLGASAHSRSFRKLSLVIYLGLGEHVRICRTRQGCRSLPHCEGCAICKSVTVCDSEDRNRRILYALRGWAMKR